MSVEFHHYHGWRYNTKQRFASYWHQIDEVLNFKPDSLVEIGVGSGVLRTFTEMFKIPHTRVDILSNLQPTVLASVDALPFASGSYDICVCCQVLEHIPYKNSMKAVREIRRVVRKGAVISVPDRNHFFQIALQSPIMRGRLSRSIPRVRPVPAERVISEHQWEIGVNNIELDQIVHDIEQSGFKVERTYRVDEMPYHRFFILHTK